jgi:hypothetical protein
MTSISNGQIQSAEWEEYLDDGVIEEVTYDSVSGSYYLVGFYDGCARNFRVIKLDSSRNEIWSTTKGYCNATQLGSYYSSDAYFRQFKISENADNIYLQLLLDGNHEDGHHHLYFNKYTGKIVNDAETSRSRDFEFKKTAVAKYQSFQKQWYRDRINRLEHDLISGNTSSWFYHLIDRVDVDFIMERNDSLFIYQAGTYNDTTEKDSLFVISRNSGLVSDISEVHELNKSVTYLWRGDARMKENGTAFWYESLIDNYPYANRYDSAFVMGSYNYTTQEIDSVSLYFDKETSIHQYEWINDRLHFYMNRGDTAIWSIYDLYGQQLWTKEFLSFHSFRLKNVELVDDGYIISGRRDGKMYMAKYKKSESLSVALGSDRLENQKATSFELFPNPADNQFRISLSSDSRNAEMRIQNMKGQLIKSINISDQETVDISGLNSGVYIVQIKSESEQSFQSKKLIIQ